MMWTRATLLAVCWALGAFVLAPARTLTVGQGGAQFQSIQAAIEAAQPGDVIEVAPGTYRESVVIAKDGVILLGSGSDRTTIESSTTVVSCLGVQSGRVEGFSLRHTGSQPGPAVLASASSLVIADTVITGATGAGVEIGAGDVVLLGSQIKANQGGGVLIHSRARATLIDNAIAQNGLQGGFAGVQVRGSSTATLRFNRIWLNGGSGVFVHGNSQAQLVGNSLIGNGLHGVSALEGGSVELISSSFFWNGQVGIRLGGVERAIVAGNFIAHNPLGLISQTQSLARGINLFIQNDRDIFGLGISPQEGRFIADALAHPQVSQLFQTLAQLGSTVKSLQQAPSDAQYQELVAQAQAAELIGAEIYLLGGLAEEAKIRFNLVIRLNPASPTADQARARLEQLG